ncbi:hypothetical protein [Propionimicrobium sp. PCR01-08-3]|uniref:hypothetical protein n=1 Tax=Propionimicrobium sp. PCR01-08-3 TaxID=3052086 RepID=UPI00255C94C0|nr:hypothetical protein [Propionimicrobium sp. PCR01-08-3]WIY83695.1 hypothetical protein QQ658_04915 [Propionimicrobium sp. PCR01-08-3]
MSDSPVDQPGSPSPARGPNASASAPGPEALQAVPLLVSDPPKIGDFWLDARLTGRESGVVYLAHADDQPEVMLIVLAEGASRDPAARDRLAGEVNKLHAESVAARGGDGQDGGRLGYKYRSEADDPVSPEDSPIAPWVALFYDGSTDARAEADRLLRSVDLSSTPELGSPAGPDYRLHWLDDSRPGAWRVWPAVWPGRHDRTGWVPLAVSWSLTILLCGLALLIAVLLFQNSPPESPQPPVPTNQSQSASGGGSGSDSGSPEESGSESGSPEESGSDSGSPESSGSDASGGESSPGEDGSPSKEPSMGTGGEGSATDTQPPTSANTRL